MTTITPNLLEFQITSLGAYLHLCILYRFTPFTPQSDSIQPIYKDLV